MGDRANVYIRNDSSSGVYLYTHWSGSELAATVQSALVRGKSRWTDTPYLTRIIFCEMVKGAEMDLTGFGIAAQLCDNSHPIIVVDCDKQAIGLAPEPHDGDSPTPITSWPFETYCAFSAEALEHMWRTSELSV